jgi:hypothetical protein
MPADGQKIQLGVVSGNQSISSEASLCQINLGDTVWNGTSGAGLKLVLWEGDDSGNNYVGFGVEGSKHISVVSKSSYDWYWQQGTNVRMILEGDGLLTTKGDILVEGGDLTIGNANTTAYTLQLGTTNTSQGHASGVPNINIGGAFSTATSGTIPKMKWWTVASDNFMGVCIENNLVNFQNTSADYDWAWQVGTAEKMRLDAEDSILMIQDTGATSATAGGQLMLQADDGAVMASGHRLGVIKFAGAEDTSSTITVGARIEALCDATWSATENGASLLFYTTDANASESEVLKLDSNKLATFADNVSLASDAAVLSFGAGSDVTFTHDNGTGMDITSAGNLDIDCTAGSITLGASLADGQTLKLGKNGAVETIIAPHGTAGSEAYSVINTAGTTDGAEAEGAILLEAVAGGIGLHGADDKDIWVEAGQVVLTANHDTAASIKLHADAGSSQTIQLLNDAGTAAAAIELTATAGSVDINSGDNITIDASDDIALTTGTADGLITLHSAHTAGQAILIDANADAGSILDIDAGILDIDVQADAAITSTSLTVTTDTATFTSANAEDPLVVIKNTTNDTDGAILRFVKDKGAAGAANDFNGRIQFFGDDANQDQVKFSEITSQVAVHTNGQEGGKLSLGVATHDGEMQFGLVLVDGNAEDEIDVTIGNGTSSVTTIAGVLDLGDRNIQNVGQISCDTITADAASAGLHIDLAGVNTGTSKITLNHGLADAFSILDDDGDGARTYMKFVTTDGQEHINVPDGVLLGFGSDVDFTFSSSTANTLTVSGQDLSVESSTSTKPLLVMKNTTNDAHSAILRFISDKGAAGGDGDSCGKIEFFGDDDNQDNIKFASIEGLVADASNGDECGALYFYVAENDGNNTAGLKITGTTSDGRVDVEIGAGTASVTTIAGTLDLGDRNITNVGDISLDSLSSDGSLVTINAPAEIANGSSGGASALILDNDDTNQIALEIQAANIDADVIDITADAVTTANVLDVTADGLTTGGILNLVSDSDDNGTRSLVTIHNDNTDGINATLLDLKQDAGAGGVYEMMKATGGLNGAAIGLRVKEQSITIATGAGTTTSNNFFPANAIPIALHILVTTAITNGAADGNTFITKLGTTAVNGLFANTGGSAFSDNVLEQQNDNLTFAIPAGNDNFSGNGGVTSAQNLVITCGGANPNAGVVRATLFYYQLTVDTSA